MIAGWSIVFVLCHIASTGSLECLPEKYIALADMTAGKIEDQQPYQPHPLIAKKFCEEKALPEISGYITAKEMGAGWFPQKWRCEYDYTPRDRA